MLFLESSEGQLNAPFCLWFKGKAEKGESEREKTAFGNGTESSCEWRPDSSVCFVFNSSSRSSFPAGGFTINELTGKSTKSTKSTCNFSTLLVIHCSVNTNGITNTTTQGRTTCSLSSFFFLETHMLCFRIFCDKNAISQGFWRKTAVFSLPATKILNPPSSVRNLKILNSR